MRTTITIREDLARRLQDEMNARGTSFRRTLESVLERGFEQSSSPSKKDFHIEPHPMGLKAGIDPVRLDDLDTDQEVERFLDIARKQDSPT